MREKIHECITCSKHISMNQMLMDPLAKGLAIGVFHDHVIKMSLIKSFDVLS